VQSRPAWSTTSDIPKVAAPQPPPKDAVREEDIGKLQAQSRRHESDARVQVLDERFDKGISGFETAAPRTETKVIKQPVDPRPQRSAREVSRLQGRCGAAETACTATAA